MENIVTRQFGDETEDASEIPKPHGISDVMGSDANADAEASALAAIGEETFGDEAGEEDASEADLPALPFVSVVEAILFAAREPLKPAHIARAVGKGTRQDAVRAAVEELNVHYLESGRAFEIAEISGRFQLMSRPEYVEYIRRIYPKRDLSEKDRMVRLSPSALDALAIIAYKQPITRGEIEHIRGVGSGPVLRALMERGTVKVVGKAQVVGQPWLYGTTESFLAEFGLGSLDELPLRNEFLGLVGGSAEAFGEIGCEPGESEDSEAEATDGFDGEFIPEAETIEEEEPTEGEESDEDGKAEGDPGDYHEEKYVEVYEIEAEEVVEEDPGEEPSPDAEPLSEEEVGGEEILAVEATDSDFIENPFEEADDDDDRRPGRGQF